MEFVAGTPCRWSVEGVPERRPLVKGRRGMENEEIAVDKEGSEDGFFSWSGGSRPAWIAGSFARTRAFGCEKSASAELGEIGSGARVGGAD